MQIGKATIQEELESALERITQQATRVIAAGRTDAGVHATGQVIHFLSEWRHAPLDLQRALNAVLPKTIAITGLDHAAADFHARYSAQSRLYRYDILNSATRSPIEHRYALHRSTPLNVAAMHEALQSLTGRHDFRAFTAGDPAEACTVRDLRRASCRRRGDMVQLRVEANAFLRHMVRRIVGTAIEIGEGRKPIGHMEQALKRQDKALAGPTAPAKGLFLVGVTYPAALAPHWNKEDQAV